MLVMLKSNISMQGDVSGSYTVYTWLLVIGIPKHTYIYMSVIMVSASIVKAS